MRTVLVLITSLVLALALPCWAGEAAPKAEDLIELGKRVEERVIKLRGLPSKTPIRWEVTSKEKVRAYLLQTLKEQYGPGELEHEGKALAALDLIPRTLDYATFVVALYEEQVGGYYDPKRKTFFLADWIAPQMQESIISHEVTHALQDQTFKIDKFVDRIKGNSDAMYARSALVEGEATLVMMLDAMRALGADLDPSLLDLDGLAGRFALSMSTEQFPKFNEAPRALREALMFPYLKGLTFVSEGRKRGGWKRIDQVYSDLPASTEQVMHPEKYFDKRDEPQIISLGFLDQVPLPGWENIYEDVLGEFMTLQLLDPLGDLAEEKIAAAGWGGDRVRVYAKGDDLAWVQFSRWDSDDDAVEYAGAFAKTVSFRAPGFELQPPRETRMVWKNGAGRVVLVERRGVAVLILQNLEEDAAEAIRQKAFSH